jgi:hypothetical protein
MVVDKRRDGLLICMHLYLQDLEAGPKCHIQKPHCLILMTRDTHYSSTPEM